MNTKIKNEKHIAVLGAPVTVETMNGPYTYKKGHRANVRGMYENDGEYIVEGHGIGHTIPLDHFNRFYRVWDEVETTSEKGKKVVKTTHHKVDDTADTLAWFAERDGKASKSLNASKRGVLRTTIAHLRQTIKDVKSGEAENQLTKFIDELAALK